jgi:hypothetical protein
MREGILLCLRLVSLGLLALCGPAVQPEIVEWPNAESKANSDAWISANHDRISVMRPKFLVINFSNRAKTGQVSRMTRDLIAVLAGASRYHGYADSNAPAFLQYEVFKEVDLRDQSGEPNSKLIPLKPGVTNDFNVRYSAFFEEAFAQLIGVKDSGGSGRYLRLDELVDRGMVHEVLLFCEGEGPAKAYEVVELKPRYDENFQRIPNSWVQAGNGGDREQKWTGRSLRIGFVNASRGIGCYLESLSHGMEGTATSAAIPYFSKHFKRYAGLDLKDRWGVPFKSFYELPYGKEVVRYPSPDRAVVQWRGGEIVLSNYVAEGGNVHWPPNGRQHYDLANTNAVMSTIEDWMIGSGPGGKDIARPWSNSAFAQYRKLAPDCDGPWLVYWRQNMPGLRNKQRDEAGVPMKNWWPFLFY